MSYRIETAECVLPAIERIVDECCMDILHHFSDGSPAEAAIHEARKDCKKIRSLLRLLRDSPDIRRKEWNACLREAAGRLSGPRAAQVMVTTLEWLQRHSDMPLHRDDFAFILTRLEHAENRVLQRNDMEDRVTMSLEDVQRFNSQFKSTEFNQENLEKAVIPGAVEYYKRARKAMVGAVGDNSGESFHEWRKRVKDHWYHMRLIRNCWKKPMKAREKCVGKLGKLLGRDHDLYVFRCHLEKQSESFGDDIRISQLVEMIGKESNNLRHKAVKLGEKLFVEKKKRFCKRISFYWNSRHSL